MANSNLDRVKTQPGETDSSQPLVSDQLDKKVKISRKKKNKSSGENEKLSYVHVRAHCGKSTYSYSLAQEGRRLMPRLKLPQELVPGCDKSLYADSGYGRSTSFLGYKE
ncbi:unnamed protein product [Brassica oleracea var. botrytis]